MEEGGQNDEESHPYGVLFFKHPLKNARIACPAAGQSLVWCLGLLPGSNRRMPVHTTDSLAQATALHRDHGMGGGNKRRMDGGMGSTGASGSCQSPSMVACEGWI